MGRGSPDAEAAGGGLSGRREAREQRGPVAASMLTPQTPATRLIGLPAHRWGSDPGKRDWLFMREPHMMWASGPIPSPGTGNAGQGHPGGYKTIRIQGSEVRKHFQTFMGLRGSDHCKNLIPYKHLGLAGNKNRNTPQEPTDESSLCAGGPRSWSWLNCIPQSPVLGS